MTPYDQISSPWTCGSQWAKIRGIPWTNTHNMAAAYLFIQSSSFYVNYLLTLFLLVSSADNLCKQLGPRSGLTKCQAWSGSKLFDTLIVFIPKRFFSKKKWFWKKKTADNKNACKITQQAKVSRRLQLVPKQMHSGRMKPYLANNLSQKAISLICLSICSVALRQYFIMEANTMKPGPYCL